MNMVATMKYSGPAQALVKAIVKKARANKRTLEGWQVSIACRRRLCDRVRCVNLRNKCVGQSNPISPRSTFLSVCLRLESIGVNWSQLESLVVNSKHFSRSGVNANTGHVRKQIVY